MNVKVQLHSTTNCSVLGRASRKHQRLEFRPGRFSGTKDASVFTVIENHIHLDFTQGLVVTMKEAFGTLLYFIDSFRNRYRFQ
eukprot:14605_5